MVRSMRDIFFRAEIISEPNDFRNSTRNWDEYLLRLYSDL